MTKARIAFVDLETAPSLGYTWGKYEQTVISFEHDWYLLSFAYKWQGETKIHSHALVDYPEFRRNHKTDRALTRELWKVFDAADIIVAHNGDNFDIPKANTRFLYHRLQPPTPYKTVDTKKMAKRHFQFDSNKLDDLGKCLGLGRKMVHTGFSLWERCMAGEEKAFTEMRRYNMQDILLLERVYLKLRSWSNTHPVVALGEGTGACPKCGGKKVHKRGFAYTGQSRKQRYQCQGCGGWFEGGAKRLGVVN